MIEAASEAVTWDLGPTVRFLLLLTTAVLLLGTVGKVGRAFLKLVPGQKFLLVGVVGFMAYTVCALYAAIEVNLEFSWRLLWLVLGVGSMSCWMVEPTALFSKRWGHRPFTTPRDDADPDTTEQ